MVSLENKLWGREGQEILPPSYPTHAWSQEQPASLEPGLPSSNKLWEAGKESPALQFPPMHARSQGTTCLAEAELKSPKQQKVGGGNALPPPSHFFSPPQKCRKTGHPCLATVQPHLQPAGSLCLYQEVWRDTPSPPPCLLLPGIFIGCSSMAWVSLFICSVFT